MSGMSREEMFEAARKKREQQKKQKSSFGGGSGGAAYQDIAYTAINVNEDKVVRILGAPYLLRQEKTDPKLFFYSQIRADDGKKMRVIWTDPSEDRSWFLWKVFDKVMANRYNRTTNKREYLHEKTHPEIFELVNKNGQPDNKYENGWYPKKFVALNVIDRHDMEWHKKHKQTKILSKKASEMPDGTFWYDPGVSEYTYQMVWDNLVEFYGDWEKYDIAFRKKTESPFYNVRHGVTHINEIMKDARPFIVQDPLTEEEQMWSRYDFDSMYKVTSIIKIKNRLANTIKKIDAAFSTNFYDELEELVEKEQERLDNLPEEEKKGQDTFLVSYGYDVQTSSNEQSSGGTATVTTREDKEEEAEETPTRPTQEEEAPVRERKPAAEESSEEIDWNGLAEGKYQYPIVENQDYKYLGVPKMTDEEKSMVTGIDENGQFLYVKEWKGQPVQLYKNVNDDFKSPEQFAHDPISGSKY